MTLLFDSLFAFGPLTVPVIGHAAVATLFVAAAWGLGRLIRHPGLRHALWIAVLVKFLIPAPLSIGVGELLPASFTAFSSTLSSSIASSAEARSAEIALAEWKDPAAVDFAAEPDAMAEPLPVDPSPVTPEVQNPEVPNPEAPSSAAPLAAKNAETGSETVPEHSPIGQASVSEEIAIRPGLPVIPLLAAVWVIGTLIVSTLAVVRIGRFARMLRRTATADAEAQHVCDVLAKRAGIARPPQVRLVDARISPLLWGGLNPLSRPSLIFPRALWQDLNAVGREAVLAHELAHAARRDHWVRRLELLVTAVWWWHPAVWFGRRQLHEAEEQCCDAWVAAHGHGGRAYADALLNVLDYLAEPMPTLPPVACGVGRLSSLERRLVMILHNPAPRPLGRKSRLMFALLLLPLLAFAPTLAQEKNTNPAGTIRIVKPRGITIESAEAIEVMPPEEAKSNDAAETSNTVITRSAAPVAPMAVIPAPNGETFAAEVTPDGKSFVTVGEDRVVRVFTPGSRLRLELKGFFERPLTAAVIAPDGKSVVVGGADGKLIRFDLKTGQKVAEAQQAAGVRSLSISRDAKWLGSGGEDGIARIWNGDTLEPLGSTPDQLRVGVAAVSHEGGWLVTGAKEGHGGQIQGSVRIWKIHDNSVLQLRAENLGHQKAVMGIKFHRDDKMLLTFAGDGLVRIAQLPDHGPIDQPDVVLWHPAAVTAAAFVPGTRMIATGDAQGVVRFWDPDRAKFQGVVKQTHVETSHHRIGFEAHDKSIHQLTFTPDGALLITNSDDRQMKVWRTGLADVDPNWLSDGERWPAVEPPQGKGKKGSGSIFTRRPRGEFAGEPFGPAPPIPAHPPDPGTFADPFASLNGNRNGKMQEAGPQRKEPGDVDDPFGPASAAMKTAVEPAAPPTPQTAQPPEMSLEEAVRIFNLEAKNDPVGKSQPPLTVDEVIAAIRWFDRETAPVTDEEFAEFRKIAETKRLPARTRFDVITKFVPGDGREYTRWSVRILMPQTSKPGWTYAYSIRERTIGSEPVKEKVREKELLTPAENFRRQFGLGWLSPSPSRPAGPHPSESPVKPEAAAKEAPKEEALQVRVYPIADLLLESELARLMKREPQATSPAITRGMTLDELTDLVLAVQPQFWEENGGKGTLKANEQTLSLVIRQTTAMHDRIAEQLRMLRAQILPQVSYELRVIRGPAALLGSKPTAKRRYNAAEFAQLLHRFKEFDSIYQIVLPKPTVLPGTATISVESKDQPIRQVTLRTEVLGDVAVSVTVKASLAKASEIEERSVVADGYTLLILLPPTDEPAGERSILAVTPRILREVSGPVETPKSEP